MDIVEQSISQYLGIQAKDVKKILPLFKNESLAKNDYLLKTDQYAKSISFVRSGFLRVYALDEKGEKEITQWISNQGMFITDLSSFMFDTPSRWNIQALTVCDIFTISKEEYNNLGSFIPQWDHLEKLFIAKCFVTLENRVFQQLSMSAEQKVRQLYDYNAEIFLHVPHQYIASMLGITPETLSRIRRKLIS